MSNLTELTLFLMVTRKESTYIDGTHLHDDVLSYMPRLTQFIFSISAIVYNVESQALLPSNDDVQCSFTQRGNQQIGSSVIPGRSNIEGDCHVYSIPYSFGDFCCLPSRFPGGKFDKVRRLTMHDIHPFEHQLFEIIARDFPFLRTLHVMNDKPQQNKNSSLSCITFPHLSRLDLSDTHADYAEEFLFKKNIHLPHLSSLRIDYELLAIVTNNFADDVTRFNCA